jgi:hypothetical protein
MRIAFIIVLAIVVIAVVGIGAYQFGESNGLTQAQTIRSEFFQSRSTNSNAQGGTNSQQGTNVRSQTGRPVASGTIKSIDGTTIQLTQQDGSTATVSLNAQTVIQKVVVGSATDLQIGERITVQGTQTNGQTTAQSIQISQGGQ